MSGPLLYPFHSLLGHVDHFNKMCLDRLRSGTSRFVSGVRGAGARRWAPLLLFSVLVVYLFMGSACFWVIEHEPHEKAIRQWYMTLAVNRRHFARSISSRIFNDTRNLLIIIDREQTERVQQLLVESLKRYEDRLDLEVPDKQEWTFLNSFNYAYGLLLTLGHGSKIPDTGTGQVFAMIYCLLGIPLFYGTIALCVYTLLSPFLKSTVRTVKSRLLVMYLVIALYVIWSLLLALFLYYQVFDSFWTSVFAAFLSGLTVQVPLYSSFSPTSLLLLLGACTISAAILIMAVILVISVYCTKEACTPSKKAPLLEQTEQQTQKFTIIVDEAGESKLAEETTDE